MHAPWAREPSVRLGCLASQQGFCDFRSLPEEDFDFMTSEDMLSDLCHLEGVHTGVYLVVS